MWRREAKDDGTVFRITGARQSLTEDVNARQRRYLVAMLVRTVAVVMTVVLWNVSRPLAVVALVLGVLIPYVAVVIANGGREKARALPTAHLVGPARRELPGPGGTGADRN